jgi:hypothetical protein
MTVKASERINPLDLARLWYEFEAHNGLYFTVFTGGCNKEFELKDKSDRVISFFRGLS